MVMPGRNYGDGCSCPGCPSVADGGQGMCKKHYQRWKKHGDPSHLERAENGKRPLCAVEEGCDRLSFARGLCKMHYERLRRAEIRELNGVPPKRHKGYLRARKYDVQWNLWMPAELADVIEAAAAEAGLNRNDWLRAALSHTVCVVEKAS
jgi:hypothetical protein